MHSAWKTPTIRKEKFRVCFQDLATVTPAKMYTRKELVMMDTSIDDFHTGLYITEIKTWEIPNKWCDPQGSFGDNRGNRRTRGERQEKGPLLLV